MGPRVNLRWVALVSVMALLPAIPVLGPGAAFTAHSPSAPVLAKPPVIPLSSGPASPFPESTPSYVWSTAQISYGPGDPSGLLFGEGAVMAVDDRLQNTVSFGGQARDGLSGITLVYDNSSNGTWWYAGSAISPPARSNATFASYPPGDLAVLFGGLGNLAPARTYRDTWAYYFYNETWVNISQTSGPPARENAAMAVDPTDGLALLFGGMDPAYSSGGATGTAVWNDTWELNLTTFTWSPLVLGSSPPALLGSSMVWDPVTAEFVLFGGCDTSHCSDTVYTYVPGQRAWSLRSVGGAVPSGRGSASFAWDPVDNGSILFGGFAPGPAGPTALGDTYYLSPTVSSWSTIPSQGGPPPTYGAASAFSDYPGCVGFWVQGGSPALQSIIYNDSLLEPVTSLRPNCFTPFGGGTGGGPPPPCSNTSAHVTVQVRDALTGRGVGGSDVIVSGSCGTSHGITGVDGFVNLTEAAPDILNVRADAVGYHGQNLTVTYTGAPGAVVRVDLNPLPSLSARIFGASLTGRVPLPNATITINGALIVGRSNALGWVNASRVPDSTPVLVVSGSATDFGPGSVTVAYPYTGVVYANLTLSAFGALTVRVRDNQTGAPIAGATIDLRFIDPVGANTSVVFSGADGNYSSALEAGNYSYTVSETGYFSNSSSAPVYHPWIAPTLVDVNLSRVYGADVDVHVVDSTTGNPVALATVTLGGSRTVATDVRGWANVSNVQPPGLVRIDVSAWGFYPNSTTVTIGPYVVLNDVEVPLHPAPPCSPYSSCPNNSTGGPPPTLELLPPPGVVRSVLLVAPIALAVVGALVVTLYRWRAARTARAPERPGPRREGPVGSDPGALP